MALFARLKDETEPDHRRLEQELDLTRDGLTLDRYRERLQAFHGFVSVYEPALESGAPASWIPLMQARRRCHWLRQDLLTLGLGPGDIDDLPCIQRLPPMQSLAERLGCMYVMEGSTLGGLIIAKQLQRCLPGHAQSASRYFTSYGSDTARNWHEFRRHMDDALLGAEHDEAIAAARGCFESLLAWFIATRHHVACA